jgi:hypothetical protein
VTNREHIGIIVIVNAAARQFAGTATICEQDCTAPACGCTGRFSARMRQSQPASERRKASRRPFSARSPAIDAAYRRLESPFGCGSLIIAQLKIGRAGHHTLDDVVARWNSSGIATDDHRLSFAVSAGSRPLFFRLLRAARRGNVRRCLVGPGENINS